MVRMLFGLFLEKLGELVLSPIWSKVVDKTTDKAVDGLNNFNEFELILKTLQKNLKSLSAKASDVEEGIKNAELSGRKKRKREVEEWLAQVKLFEKEVDKLGGSQAEPEGFIKRLTEGGKAAQLDKQVKELVEQGHSFGELVLDVCGTSGEAFLTKGLVGQAFGEYVEKILRLLESGEVSSIGLYGMGGVGKTTLAQHINNRLKQHPERRVYWVTVSQEFTVTGLQDKIARLLGLNLSDEDEVGKRAMRLQTALSQQKSSVLILDDLWDNIDLSDVGCDSSVDGCKLIITTRSVAVCHGIGCEEGIPVEKLDEGEAWKLFRERLGNKIELDPEVEGTAKSMVKLCGGLPLAIITVAGSMRGKRGSHRWKDACVELKKRVKGHDRRGEDEVFKVLKFSFDRLKEENDKSNEFNMKQLCFLYCSLYPEDYKIYRDELVGKFISGGLLDESRSWREQTDQGHSILDELVDVCLLETCVDFWNRECVKMHDLVRGMALKICKGKYMVRAGERSLKEIPNVEEWTQGLEKVSLMQCDIRRIGEGLSPYCPKLSTLLLQWNTELKVIPESFFCKMQGLCTLDLSWNLGITMLPNSLSDITSLKSLLLEGCIKLEKVPYLGKLKALRELNLSSTAIKEAPQGLDELLNLRFLSMNAYKLELFPKGVLPKLGHLQHLDLPFHIQVEIEEIKNLKQLEELGGGLENVSDFNWFITTFGVHDPPGYAIHVGSPFIKGYRYGRDLRGKNNELLFGKNVNDEKILAKGVAYLTIDGCEGLSKWFEDDLSERFDNPTSLKRLKISKCGGIEWIFRSDDCQGSQISTPQEIILEYLDDMKGVVGVMERERGGIGIVAAAAAQPPVFSSLKSLSITKCNKMRKLGLPVLALPNLERLDISYGEEVEDLFEEDEGRAADSVLTLPKLERLDLKCLPRLRKVGLQFSSVPNLKWIHIDSCGEIQEIFEDEDEGRAADSVLSTLPKLEHLRLYNLPRLKRVSKATIISNSIEKIWIRRCPRLMKKLPLHFDDQTPPPSLREIKVDREWWDSLEEDTRININPNLLKFENHIPSWSEPFEEYLRYTMTLGGGSHTDLAAE